MKIRLTLFIACFCPLGFATFINRTPIPELYNRSTVIFVGQEKAAHELPQQEGTGAKDWSMDYTPLRIYKGGLGPLASITINYPIPGSVVERHIASPVGSYLIFATTGHDGNGLVLTEPTFSLFGFSLDVATAPDDATKPTLDGTEAIEADILALALRANHNQSSWETAMLRLLEQFPTLSTTTLSTLKQHAPFSDPEDEFIRLAFLANAEPEKYFHNLAASLASMDSPTFDEVSLTFNIFRKRNTQTNPEDLDILENLANAPAPFVRSSAIYRLRELRDPRAIDFLLAKLQNNNTSPEDALDAMWALAETTGRLDLAAVNEQFAREPDLYKAKWAEWSKKRSLTPPEGTPVIHLR